MLSLITHEPHFFIIRESLNENIWKKCEFCGGNGHMREECPKLLNPHELPKNNTELIHSIEFSIIKCHIVREYLELEFKNVKLNFECEAHLKSERFIDDFVFLCFFVGNDFIPHLPSLKIREGAIDALLYLYKKILPSLDGFLTEGNGKINLPRTEKLFEKLALVEDEIFKKQLMAKNRELQRNAQRAVQQGYIDKSHFQDEIVREYFNLKKPAKEVELTNNEEIQLFDDILDDIEKIIDRDEEAIEREKLAKEKINQEAEDNFKRVLKEMMKKDSHKKMENYKDTVKLGEEGWKSRYYHDKFKVSSTDTEFKSLIRQSYIEGICWVFSYYYNGCVSWEWYYPFHYAPFASDLCEIKDLTIEFKLGLPFEPVQQLLSVLPPYSSSALPKCLRPLMHEPLSELSDFYPDTIKLDINGQAYAWMGVNLIPFIDENRIRKAVDARRHNFSEDESMRNRFGETLVFYDHKDHFISRYVEDNFNSCGYYNYISSPNFRIFAGKVKCAENNVGIDLFPGKTIKSPIKGLKIKEVKNCNIVSMVFENPPSKPHDSVLRKGVLIPPKVVIEDNLDYTNKRNFRGDEAIEIVRRTLGYDPEDVEQQFRSGVFDYTYNNNRAIERDPEQMDMLRKKRYQQNNPEDYRDAARGDRGQRYDRGQGQNNNYNPNYNQNFNPRRDNNYNRNFNQGGYQQNYNQSYQKGYQQQNYNQNYNQNYQQQNYNKNRNYNQGGYQQQNYPQSYTQQGYNQQGYNQQGNFNPYNNPNLRYNYNKQTNNPTPNNQNDDYDLEKNIQKGQELNQNQKEKSPTRGQSDNKSDKDKNYEDLNKMVKTYQTYSGSGNNNQK
jgi:5'-3' exonuclease